MPTPPDPLDSWLEGWKEPSLPASLAPEVWRRLAAGETRPRPGLGAALDSWLARPPFAILFVTCCALAGLFIAEVRVNRAQRAHSAELARSYLQLIDPLLHSGPAAQAP